MRVAIMDTVQFGYHLTLDLYGCEEAPLNNMQYCYRVIEKLVPALGMHSLISPIIISTDGNETKGGKDPGGFSGFVIIQESHISLHTFVRRGFVSIDVYSCKNGLNVKTIINYFKKAFSLKDTEVNFIKRGTRYPAQNIA